ncbi:C39 family peptidase [Nocardioidaceae bacterium SCSIO 66511]|nr:C39 family peptidase [Nocardioidaceae bacterium SCSIO 66511]
MNIRVVLGVPVAAGLIASALSALPANAAPADEHAPRGVSYQRFDDSDGFLDGKFKDVHLRGDRLALGRHTKRTTIYRDPFGSKQVRRYDVGNWTSPVVRLGFKATEAIPSWNATTPTGSWVETRFRGRHADGSWTKWYVMGRWTSGMDFKRGDIHRTSVDGQGDGDGTVWTDTFSAEDGKEVKAYQLRVRLLRPHDAKKKQVPTVSAVGAMASEDGGEPGATSEPTLDHAVELDVPQFSQNIHRGEYPEFGGGGQVWCSPTSTTMVQYSWGKKYHVKKRDLRDIDAPNGDPQVDYAAMNAWDYTYEGAGNWPFNAAYASTFGLETFVTRLRSLAEAERFIDAGIPVIISLAFTEEEMPEAGYGTDGHLMVLRGFTEDGDPILNDPASDSNEGVRNVYTRENFEKVWQQSSEGVVYIYHPKNVALPDNVEGAPANW